MKLLMECIVFGLLGFCVLVSFVAYCRANDIVDVCKWHLNASTYAGGFLGALMIKFVDLIWG